MKSQKLSLNWSSRDKTKRKKFRESVYEFKKALMNFKTWKNSTGENTNSYLKMVLWLFTAKKWPLLWESLRKMET